MPKLGDIFKAKDDSGHEHDELGRFTSSSGANYSVHSREGGKEFSVHSGSKRIGDMKKTGWTDLTDGAGGNGMVTGDHWDGKKYRHVDGASAFLLPFSKKQNDSAVMSVAKKIADHHEALRDPESDVSKKIAKENKHVKSTWDKIKGAFESYDNG